VNTLYVEVINSNGVTTIEEYPNQNFYTGRGKHRKRSWWSKYEPRASVRISPSGDLIIEFPTGDLVSYVYAAGRWTNFYILEE
jgi:hypothetical protein